jgi:hypothetical protein
MSLRGAYLRYSMSASRRFSYGRADALPLTWCLFATFTCTPIRVLSLERSPLRNGFHAKWPLQASSPKHRLLIAARSARSDF